MILALHGRLSERIIKGVTSQRQSSPRVRNGGDQSLSGSAFGLIQDEGAKSLPCREKNQGQTGGDGSEVEIGVLQKTMEPFLPSMCRSFGRQSPS